MKKKNSEKRKLRNQRPHSRLKMRGVNGRNKFKRDELIGWANKSATMDLRQSGALVGEKLGKIGGVTMLNGRSEGS